MKAWLDRMMKAIDHVAEEVANDIAARTEFKPVRAAMEIAVYRLRDELKTELDIREFLTRPVKDVYAASEAFCYGYCLHGQEAEPGEHARCDGCPLRVLTVDKAQEDMESILPGGTSAA